MTRHTEGREDAYPQAPSREEWERMDAEQRARVVESRLEESLAGVQQPTDEEAQRLAEEARLHQEAEQARLRQEAEQRLAEEWRQVEQRQHQLAERQRELQEQRRQLEEEQRRRDALERRVAELQAELERLKSSGG